MKILFKNANVIDVINLTSSIQDVVVEDNKIIYVGNNYTDKVDKTINVEGKWICPSFIDGHIHIESTMLNPYNFALEAIKHGTGAIIADPHEITNVAGLQGLDYMLEASQNLPMDVFMMIPSCVPATQFDDSKQEITAEMIEPYFKNQRVLGLGELMNFTDAINYEPKTMAKINLAKKYNKLIDGHAPGLLGDNLKKYVELGINSDHECSTIEEAIQRINLGMWIMIREGSAAKNLEALAPLINSYYTKCLFVTDDMNAADLIKDGHIDRIIRKAIKLGYDPIKCISLASLNAAKCFNLKNYGSINKGCFANFIVLDDLNELKINQVYKDGKLVFDKTKEIKFDEPSIEVKDYNEVFNSMNPKELDLSNLSVQTTGKHQTRVIEIIPGQLITNEKIMSLNFDKNNGIDVSNDILKIVVVERHNKTGNITIGYVKGFGLQEGAIASTVSHDSHNIIAIGCSDQEIMLAIRKIIAIGGGNVIVKDNEVVDCIDFKIAGLMSDQPIEYTAKKVEEIRQKVYSLGISKEIEPFMNMAFISLPVIPNIKITTKGLVDVNKNQLIELFPKIKEAKK